MKVKREKAQIKVKQDKYYLNIKKTTPPRYNHAGLPSSGGTLDPTTPNAIAKKADELGNTVPNADSLKFRNLSQTDDKSWVNGSQIKSWSRVQGNSTVDSSTIGENVVINNSKVSGCNIQGVNHCIIENSTVSGLIIKGGAENIIIRNAEINGITIIGSDVKIIDCTVSGGGTLGSSKKPTKNVELNGCSIKFDGEMYTDNAKFINSAVKMQSVANFEITNCAVINSDITIDSVNKFYLIDLYIEKSKLVANSSQYIYIKEYLYNSNVTFDGSKYILLKLGERTANNIAFDGAIASEFNFLEVTNCKNENLKISGNVTGTKISGYARFINSEVSGKYNHIHDNIIVENSILEIEYCNIYEKAHIINYSVVNCNRTTIKGNAIIDGEVSVDDSVIFGSAYVKNLNGANNIVFNSSVIESYNSDNDNGSFIGGNSYVDGSSGSSGSVGNTYNAIIDSNYQTNSGNVRVKTSEVHNKNISNKVIINSNLDNVEKVIFDEHDDRIWE